MENARVRFNLVVNTLVGRKNFSDDFKKYTISNIGTYPLFTVNDKSIVALPYDGYKITYAIRFEHSF